MFENNVHTIGAKVTSQDNCTVGSRAPVVSVSLTFMNSRYIGSDTGNIESWRTGHYSPSTFRSFHSNSTDRWLIIFLMALLYPFKEPVVVFLSEIFTGKSGVW